MRKALVTGGAGFIGSHVVRACLNGGFQVIVLDDLSSGSSRNIEDLPVRFLKADVRDELALAEAVRGCDVVFHLAASVGNTRSIEHPLADADVNVIGTLKLLEASRAAGVRTLVYSSSAGIFGELRTLPIREDHPVEPDSPYGASKLAAEKLCLVYARLHPMDCISLRYFNVYGTHQRHDAYGSVIPIFADRILRGEAITIFGDGEQTRDFVHVRDVAEANLRAAKKGNGSGVFNLGSGSRITINRLAELMYQAAGVAPEIRYGSPRKGDVRDSLADVSAARSAFGYEPAVKLEDGLQEYMEWAGRELVSR